jgi:type I site-specific restriction endonuclease
LDARALESFFGSLHGLFISLANLSNLRSQMVVLLGESAANADAGRRKRQQDHLRSRRPAERQYMFDAAFGADSTQAEVYERTTKKLAEAVLDGYNACVFAYGATGGGKTYTMVGTQDNPGCMVRALNDLFDAMDEDGDSHFKV